jgi:predicted RND superfamily exporter protein
VGNRLRKPIKRLTELGLTHPWVVLGGAAILTLLSGWLASSLEIHSSFEELLPPNVSSVVRIKELVRRVGGDGTVLVTIESLDRSEDLSHAEVLARELADEYSRLGRSAIRSVEYNLEPIQRWYSDHWPLFASLEDLNKANEALRKRVSRAKADLLSLHLDDEDPSATAPNAEDLGAWADGSTLLPREHVAERFRRYPRGFYVHPDGRSLTLVVRPTGTALGVQEAGQLLARMQTIVEGHADELRAHHLRVGFGGTFPILVAEYQAIIRSIGSTALLVVCLVLASLFLFFRDLRSTLALGLAMTVAVAITFGLARLTIGHLNTQTTFLWAIVVGNGINYGLIYLARLRQLRHAGTPFTDAVVESAQTAASATLLASGASAISFGVLGIAANRGFRDFGIIGGTGMLLSWTATFALLPALLAVFEKIRPLRPRPLPSRRHLPGFLERLGQFPTGIVGIFGSLIIVSVVSFARFIPRAMERNMDNVTNELNPSNQVFRDNQRAQQSLGKSIAGAIALLPTPEGANQFCAVIRERQSRPQWSPLIDGCETIQSVVPSDQEQKLALIADIRRRLSDAVLEKMEPKQAARLRQVRADLMAQRRVTVDEAPTTLIDRFRERDGTAGRIAVVTARSSAQLELEPNLEAFTQAVRNVPVAGGTYEAAGADIVVSDLLRDIETEGPRTTLLSMLGVCALVVVAFRTARERLLVIGTLISGVILMCGAAVLLNLKINFFNFIVFPITFGIAVDYGANVVARIRERNGDILASLAEVGPAVALCSWTSIVGYASLLFTVNRALRSFGWYAMIGEVTSIACALVLLPALMRLLALAPVRGQRPSIESL